MERRAAKTPNAGFYQRIFAALYDPLAVVATAGPFNKAGSFKAYRRYVAGRARGHVLEVGAGTGANLCHYHASVQLTVSDPNPHMLRRLREKAERLGLSPTVVETGLDRLPFADHSFDTVVSTLVFCSVSNPEAALAEVSRVLVPGGEFRFLEHVRAGSTAWAALQDAAAPIWSAVADGCHPNRSTLSAIQHCGLDVIQLRPFQAGPYPVRPWIAGVARKRP